VAFFFLLLPSLFLLLGITVLLRAAAAGMLLA